MPRYRLEIWKQIDICISIFTIYSARNRPAVKRFTPPRKLNSDSESGSEYSDSEYSDSDYSDSEYSSE